MGVHPSKQNATAANIAGETSAADEPTKSTMTASADQQHQPQSGATVTLLLDPPGGYVYVVGHNGVEMWSPTTGETCPVQTEAMVPLVMTVQTEWQGICQSQEPLPQEPIVQAMNVSQSHTPQQTTEELPQPLLQPIPPWPMAPGQLPPWQLPPWLVPPWMGPAWLAPPWLAPSCLPPPWHQLAQPWQIQQQVSWPPGLSPLPEPWQQLTHTHTRNGIRTTDIGPDTLPAWVATGSPVPIAPTNARLCSA